MCKNGNGSEHVPEPIPEWKEKLLANNRKRKKQKHDEAMARRERTHQLMLKRHGQPIQAQA